MNQNLSPVLLFVFNRPLHTIKTINSLKNSLYANLTDVYIFCDKPSSNAHQKCIKDNIEVIDIINSIKGFRNVQVKIRETNYGLSKNIINGVEEVLKFSNMVIVLEDDMLVSKYFLKYMNEALELYEKNDEVACVHAWNYSFIKCKNETETFFLPGGDCWGWATWKSSWNLFEKNSIYLLIKLIFKRKIFSFNRNNTENNLDLLINHILGNNDSWAIRWHASLVLNHKYCLYPQKSLLYNIGLDGSGENCENINLGQNIYEQPIIVGENPVCDSPWYYEQVKQNSIEVINSNTAIKIIKYTIYFFYKKATILLKKFK